MTYMMLLRLRPYRIVKLYNWNKCLRNLNNRLYCNADKKLNDYQLAKLNRKAKRKAFRMQLAQNIRATRAKMEEIIERENIWTIPNFLCIGRIMTTPYISYLIVCSHNYHVRYFLIIIFYLYIFLFYLYWNCEFQCLFRQ